MKSPCIAMSKMRYGAGILQLEDPSVALSTSAHPLPLHHHLDHHLDHHQQVHILFLSIIITIILIIISIILIISSINILFISI